MLGTLLIFIVILSVLVFVHELGHFLTAKRAGATVYEFGFGFPPRLFGIKRGGTIYSLNWLPLGGFVKIKGEGGDEQGAQDSFASFSASKRVLILVSGVAMNVLLAMLLFSFAFAIGAPTALDGALPPGAHVREQRIQILAVRSGSPAAEAGLRYGDALVRIDGQPVASIETLQTYNSAHANTEEQLTILRGSEERTVRITPKPLDGGEGRAVWGVELSETALVSLPWYRALWQGARTAIVLFGAIIIAFYDFLRNLLIHQTVSAEVAGPVGIAAMTGQVANLGLVYLVQFAALLSLNLAFINVLPIPALDGGRILFVLIERIRGRRVSPSTETLIHNIGFVLLILLIFAITIKDVSKLAGPLQRYVGQLLGG